MNFNQQEYSLRDKHNKVLGTLKNIKLEDGFYQGEITDRHFDENLNRLFALFEKYVSDQSLMLLDEIDEQIESYGLKISPGDLWIYDVQISGNNLIAFKLK